MIGSRLGAFAIVSELGSGGMGRVYRAEVSGKEAGLDGPLGRRACRPDLVRPSDAAG